MSLNSTINSFGLNLVAKANEPQANCFLSPYSIATALCALLNGSSNELHAELLALFSESNETSLVNNYQNLATIINAASNNATTATANGFFANNQVNPNFTKTLQTNFNAATGPLQLDQINKWCADNTNQLIPKIFNKIEPDTVCVLLNAIYFKGTWQKVFDASRTTKQQFTSATNAKSQVDMMQKSESMSYLENDVFQTVALPYDEEVTSFIILPKDASISMNDFINNNKQLLSKLFLSKAGEITKRKGTLHLPKFNIETTLKLESILQSIGLAHLVSENQLNNINKDAYVSDVIHKAVCTVDESGTVAAAITAISCKSRSRIKPFQLNCNRPFIFSIVKANTLLFLGSINQL